MTLHLSLFSKHEPHSAHCVASVGAGVICGRESTPNGSLCNFHRTLAGPWAKAATKHAA